MMKRLFAGMIACMMLAGTAYFPQYDATIAQIAFAAEQTAAANPIISRGVPAYSGSGTALHGNDDAYWTAWQSSAPDFLAYDLSGVPAAQRKQVLAVWYNDSTYDNIGSYVNKGEEPVDYVIEVNKASGGAYPNDDWETAVIVTNNSLSSRQHLVDMQGANWIRLRVTKAEDQTACRIAGFFSVIRSQRAAWATAGARAMRRMCIHWTIASRPLHRTAASAGLRVRTARRRSTAGSTVLR